MCFKDANNAKVAMEELNRKTLPSGSFLIVNYHVSKKENELLKSRPITQNLQATFNSNIYVKFIPSNVTESELRKAFGEFPV